MSLLARPVRVGVLVPEIEGFAWEAMFAAALSAQTRVWGGVANFVYPLEGADAEDELLCALVDLLDPDGWAAYCPSQHDLQQLDRARFDEWQGRLQAGLEGLVDDDVQHAVDSALAEPLADMEIPAELATLLAARGSPLHHGVAAHVPGWMTGSHSSYPMTELCALGTLPGDVLDIAPSDDPAARLLVAAETGLLSPRMRQECDERGIARSEQSEPAVGAVLRSVFRDTRREGRAPFDLASHGLAWSGPRGLARSPLTLVVGDRPRDFALAYALRRAGVFARWVPTGLLDTKGKLDLVRKGVEYRARRLGLSLAITSATDDAAAAKFAQGLPAASSRDIPVVLVGWREVLPARPAVLVAPDTVRLPQQVVLTDGRTPRLPTPLPEAEGKRPGDVRWIAEVAVTGWSPARHPAIAVAAADGLTTTEARVTRGGIAYIAPSPFIVDDTPVRHQLQHPRLSRLTLLEQVRAMAAPAGWGCELSDKGQFATGASKLFGGFGALCAQLRDDGVAALLRAYQDRDEAAPGIALSGGRRRYLSLEDIRELVADGPALLNRLESRRVLARGLVLKCERCRHADWYSARESDPAFRCSRCSLEQRPRPGHWLGDPEPRWRYRLDEVLFQFLRHRGDLPALTVYERFHGLERTYEALTELELVDPGQVKTELDFVVVEDGQLWLGEAFTDAHYGRGRKETARLERLAQVAVLLQARGVILATAADAVAESTRRRAEARFPGPWPDLELRERAFAVDRPTKLIDTPPD